MGFAEGLEKMKTGFTRSFWVANVLELFERFAFYGSKAVLAKYLAENVGLGVVSGNKLMGFYGLAVFGLPVLAGPVVDRFGFRRSLVACFSIFAAGYILIGMAALPEAAGIVKAVGPWTYAFLALTVTAIGGSLIKPCVVGTVARTTSTETKSLGYSIYYSLVNFGGALGPMLALLVRKTFGISYVFLVFGVTSVILAVATLAFFRVEEDGGERRTFAKVLGDAALVFTNLRFVSFLVIFSGFWIMFWQVFFTLPFYATDVLQFEKYELLETADAWTICLLTVPITALANRFRPIRAMTIGFFLASASWLVLAVWQSWQAVVLGLVLFALGEMTQAPRFYEYVAALAPKEQVGTFMGYAFLPVAIGYFAAGYVSAYLIRHYVQELHRPAGMWVVLSVIGFSTTALMLVYDRFIAPKPAAAAA